MVRRFPRNTINRQRRSSTIPVPAPVGGWNARDGVDAMPASDAIDLINAYPNETSVVVRRGYEESKDVGTGTVKTLAEFNSGDKQHFIAATDTSIYRVDSTPVTLASGFTEGRWDWVNFGKRLTMVNGADAAQYYDGTTAVTQALSISGLTTGMTTADFIGVTAHRSHLYFWADNSQEFWYLGTQAVQGTATSFNLSYVLNLGGKIVAMGSWSVGGAADPSTGGQFQDVLAIFMSSGQVAVYEGSNPALDFALLGVYQIGAPLSREGVMELQDDLIIITQDGVIPMSQVIRQGRVNQGSPISDKIRGAWVSAVAENKTNEGWQSLFFPKRNYALFNVPTSATVFDQYVVNLTTRAWCRFTNQNGYVWGVYNDNLYFGGTDGKIYKADTGTTDNAGDIGGGTGFVIRQSWQRLGTLLNANMMRPVVASTGSPTIRVGVNFDYASSAANLSEVTYNGDLLAWDQEEAVWDENDNNWDAGARAATANWLITLGKGRTISVNIEGNIQVEFELFSTDLLVEQGQGLT